MVCYTILGKWNINKKFSPLQEWLSSQHSGLYIWFYQNVTRRVSLVEQELLTLPKHLNSPPVFGGVHVTPSLVFICLFCRSLFVLLYFVFWPLYCLFFFDIRILITPLVSSISSYNKKHKCVLLIFIKSFLPFFLNKINWIYSLKIFQAPRWLNELGSSIT